MKNSENEIEIELQLQIKATFVKWRCPIYTHKTTNTFYPLIVLMFFLLRASPLLLPLRRKTIPIFSYFVFFSLGSFVFRSLSHRSIENRK